MLKWKWSESVKSSSPGDLPDPGIKPRSPALQADALTSEPPGKPLKSLVTSNSVTPWMVTHQAPLSMGFSRQEPWRRLPFPLQRIFPNQGTNLRLLCLRPCRQTLYHLSHQGSLAHHSILWLTANVGWMNKQMNKLINEEFCKENDPTLAKLQCVHEQSYLSLRLFISIKLFYHGE